MYPNEPVAPATDAEILNDVINWIVQQQFYRNNQQTNYTVGITAGSKLIISKVGGVTSRTAAMGTLATEIKSRRWWPQIKGVYLASTFGGDGGSNHGEMCVLAAADALGDRLVDMRCTGDNCQACAIMLRHAGVHSMNNTAIGAQSGWIHPTGRMALGSQIDNHTWDEQLAELQAFNRLAPSARAGFAYKYTRQTGYDPQGGYEPIA